MPILPCALQTMAQRHFRNLIRTNLRYQRRQISFPTHRTLSTSLQPLFPAPTYRALSSCNSPAFSRSISGDAAAAAIEDGCEDVGDDLDRVDGDQASATETDTSLEAFELHPALERNMKQAGIESLFPVQEQTLEHIRAGRDLVVRARTGTGKTLAFGIPMAEMLFTSLETSAESNTTKPQRQRRSPLALVVTPTRELALQVHKELSRLGGNNLIGVTLYGGSSLGRQIDALKGRVDFVVATPGRLRDLLQRGALSLSQLQMSVLDEADEMLNVGFQEELDEIRGYMPPSEDRQNLLFSATFDKNIMRVAKSYLHDHKTVDLVGDDHQRIPDTIEMTACMVKEKHKLDALGAILKFYTHQDESADKIQTLVFASRKQQCEFTASSRAVANSGCQALPLHGDMRQAARESALDAFRAKRVHCLIATDVAARGLDVPDVDMVIHLDMPNSMETFIHRTGRTGRAGKNGRNILLWTEGERYRVNDLQRKLDVKFEDKPIPSALKLSEVEDTKVIQDLVNIVSQDQRRLTRAKCLAEKLREMQSSGAVDGEVDFLAAALSGLFKGNPLSFSALSGVPFRETIVFSNNASADSEISVLPFNRQEPPRVALGKAVNGLKKVLGEVVAEPESLVFFRSDLAKDGDKVFVDVSPAVARELYLHKRKELEKLGVLIDIVEDAIPPMSARIVPREYNDEFDSRRNRSFKKRSFTNHSRPKYGGGYRERSDKKFSDRRRSDRSDRKRYHH